MIDGLLIALQDMVVSLAVLWLGIMLLGMVLWPRKR